MSIIGGKAGMVSCDAGISNVKKWSISSKANLPSTANSSTQGMEFNKAGNKDWSGSYEADGDTPAVYPGQKFAFEGASDATHGASGNAIVDKVDIKIDIAGGNIISHTVSFSANGALTLGAVTVTDGGVPAVAGSVGCKVMYGVPATPQLYASELPNVKSITISLSAKNASTVNSSSGGWTVREPGNWSVSVSIDCDVDTFAAIIATNTVLGLNIYVNATQFWVIDWVIFGEASNIGADVESGAIIGCTYNASFDGEQVISATPTDGRIVTPAEDTIWPAA